ncbi:histidine phosphotransferase family protein [Limimaricola pyoseonensis]|uniref:Histidine phosphotransferase ChpT n=1 Tax=Limimaricola pyoseonensis TaxID=521013 RepID=A0A1G7A2C2_9RHOB|nr:histidine phosphotransferase family protein [Limimaricola pyoseonensis]SDE09108.1 histidine phosphotransferase ChpT [Limimaricola pyoseonensis]
MSGSGDSLPALVASRICHDLINPVSAIGNGVELLAMIAAPGPEMALITESVNNAIARIRFFRIAFGAPAPGQLIGRAEIVATLDTLSHGGRTHYDWRPTEDQPRDALRLVYLLLQCVETALPQGGDVVILGSGAEWRIEASARRIRLDSDAWACLTDTVPMPPPDPGQVQFPLAAAALAASGGQLGLEACATHLALEVSSGSCRPR